MSQDHFLKIKVDERDCAIDCPDKNTKRQHRDTFGWRCDHGDLEIEFNKRGTPFRFGEKRFTARVHDRTQPLAEIDPNTEPRAYPYSVKVTLPTGRVCELDPQIIVEDERLRIERKLALPDRTAGAIVLGVGLALVGWGLALLFRREE